MFTLYYWLEIDGQDVGFTLEKRSIKAVFRAYDAVKLDHVGQRVRVYALGVTDKSGNETTFTTGV